MSYKTRGRATTSVRLCKLFPTSRMPQLQGKSGLNVEQEWIETAAALPVQKDSKELADICLVEIGGTVGDLEGGCYYEAVRQFILKVGKENCCLIFVSYIPILNGGEQKTKPAQHGVKDLRYTGLSPDFIVCRCSTPTTKEVREKVAMFTNVPVDCVFDAPNLNHLFEVPMYLNKQGIAEKISKRLGLVVKEANLTKWEKLADHAIKIDKNLIQTPIFSIAFVGKYTGFQDSYLSVIKALQYASYYANIKLEIKWIEASDYQLAETKEAFFDKFASVDGILVPGGFGERGVEGKVAAVQLARTRKLPYLGLCLGMQVAVIETCRNVLGWEDAHSTEFNPHTSKPVIKFMPEINPLVKGGTMRLGSKETLISSEDTLAYKIYGSKSVKERHRHRYEFNTDYKEEVEKAGIVFSGYDIKKERMEIVELKDHPFFFATQFHPEFQGTPFAPSKAFLAFLYAASGQWQNKYRFLANKSHQFELG
eukprot:TRINITY_DN1800_c0_g1_i1.p1 TRINITY_DN1800_c0_g1~~TRINITY_DN1800_c0_g1_i1.p1  ORF type:complete len:480 (-),score=35.17 TRINITY_DN1800_c0_g1_i1:147-1586(-)